MRLREQEGCSIQLTLRWPTKTAAAGGLAYSSDVPKAEEGCGPALAFIAPLVRRACWVRLTPSYICSKRPSTRIRSASPAKGLIMMSAYPVLLGVMKTSPPSAADFFLGEATESEKSMM